MVKQSLFLLWLLLPALQTAQAASLQASVDRSVVTEGETLVLELIQRDEVSEPDVSGWFRPKFDEALDEDSEPDIGVLASSFDVLSTARSSQINIVNGSVARSTTWRYTLSPLNRGTLTIPAITAGRVQSEPIKVKVNAAGTATGGNTAQAIFLEVDVDNDRPYVQSQVIYTVRIFRARDFYDVSLSEPKSDDVIHQRLGDDRHYSVQRKGIGYRVIERRYVLFPQKSGKVVLPSIVLDATVAGGATSQGYLGGLIPSGRLVRLRSRAITLNVQPAASAFSGNWWLPAQSLQLSENWSESLDKLRVGSPVTRTINVQAQGVLRGQFPTLSVPAIDGLKIYSDQPELNEKATAQGVIGQHTERWAIIPSRPGQYQLPELRLTWWNVHSDQQQLAMLPAKTITVLPAENTGQTPANSAPNQAAQETNNSAPVGKGLTLAAGPAQYRPGDSYWPRLVAALLLGWMLTTWVLLYQLRKKPQQNKVAHKKDTQPKALLKPVKMACASGDLLTVKQAILRWATALWPNNPPLSLLELSRRIDDSNLAGIFSAVDAAIYSGEQKKAVTGLERIPAALVKRQKWASNKLARDNPLPEF